VRQAITFRRLSIAHRADAAVDGRRDFSQKQARIRQQRKVYAKNNEKEEEKKMQKFINFQ
jgi:hypothetical protein